MRLFDFTPEMIKTAFSVLFYVSLVVTAIWIWFSWKKVEAEKRAAELTSKDLSKSLRENMKEYAELRNENTALLRRIKELESKIKRVDQPREGGRFAVKKGNNSNIGKYECIATNLDYFTPGRFYERYDNGSESLILVANNRMRRNMSYLRKSFRLVEA